MLHMAVLSAY